MRGQRAASSISSSPRPPPSMARPAPKPVTEDDAAQSDLSLRPLEADGRVDARGHGARSRSALCGAALFQRRWRRSEGPDSASRRRTRRISSRSPCRRRSAARPSWTIFGNGLSHAAMAPAMRDYIQVTDLVDAHLDALRLSARRRRLTRLQLRLWPRRDGEGGHRRGEESVGRRFQGRDRPAPSRRSRGDRRARRAGARCARLAAASATISKRSSRRRWTGNVGCTTKDCDAHMPLTLEQRRERLGQRFARTGSRGGVGRARPWMVGPVTGRRSPSERPGRARKACVVSPPRRGAGGLADRGDAARASTSAARASSR